MVDVQHLATKPVFRWTQERRDAAILLAADDLSLDEIATRVGVARETLWRWRQHPDFAAQVGDHVGQLQAAMLRYPIAKKRRRLQALDDLHAKALSVIDLRAARFALSVDTPEESARRVFGAHTVPEAATGLLVREETITASGMTSVKWQFDAPLVREIRALHEQAAKEMGQWVDRSDVETRTTEVRIVGVDAEAI